MKSSIFLVLTGGLSMISDVNAQSSEAPDALHYTDPNKLRDQIRALQLTSDSIASKLKSYNFDSIRVNSDGGITGYGSVPKDILLDNRSEADSYIMNGTRYYMRNSKPMIEPKPVSPGSNIYKLEQ